MTLKKTLSALFKEIVQETETNTDFRARLEYLLIPNKTRSPGPETSRRETASSNIKRPSNRRAAAVVDPVHLARQSESALRNELSKLDLEQLRDIVAEYGMDPGKLVLKWRDPTRVIERISEVARGRAQKGSAFRDQPSPIDRSIEPDKSDPIAKTE